MVSSNFICASICIASSSLPSVWQALMALVYVKALGLISSSFICASICIAMSTLLCAYVTSGRNFFHGWRHPTRFYPLPIGRESSAACCVDELARTRYQLALCTVPIASATVARTGTQCPSCACHSSYVAQLSGSLHVFIPTQRIINEPLVQVAGHLSATIAFQRCKPRFPCQE